MKKYNVITEMKEATVAAEYKPVAKKSTSYQTEAELEKEFIELLKGQSYEYITIKSEDDLINNLRRQIEKLNEFKFTDKEWKKFFNDELAKPNYGIKEKTRIIQDERRINFKPEKANVSKNITLIDDENIHKNTLQVINQFENEGKRKNRYDVTILVNGFPLVHIELKRRGVRLREAFNQIERYQNESFWGGSGLFEYVQIFVISNGTDTKYYSNTTRENHFKDATDKKPSSKTKTSNSFKFTSYWADATNKRIPDLIDFTRTFFSKHTILNVLTKYCIFTSDDMLLVMRPYQIVATERILNRIEIANNYKDYGTIKGGGYIWHTTGSGKTLTSFKTARLATKLPFIDKVLFVVDRNDLDYQTMREYDKYEKNCANSNKNTKILQKQLETKNNKIIITTIQKLSLFIKKNPGHEIYRKRVVIIFDECHRSQFGEMHKAIVKNFKKYHLFGFTGTPIFSVNKSTSSQSIIKTTEQAFGDKLHTYNIVDAISDGNVLPFKIDYIKTFGSKEIEDEKVFDIDRERVYKDSRRISQIVTYILDHFNQKTYRGDKTFKHSVLTNIKDVISEKDNNNIKEVKTQKYVKGFNSILAASSIDMAKLYYDEFKKQMAKNPNKKLNIALIYSFGVNEDTPDFMDEEDNESTDRLEKSDRDFLEEAIKDYNDMFKTNYDTSADKFQNYYKDVSLRVKNKEIDLLIVVNMFLTGFDATTLNTLWVDKNLRMHGLIQAFSRTNRILNSIKTFGNIVCFRPLDKQTNEALSVFGDKNASGIVLIRKFKEYYETGYLDERGKRQPSYKEMVEQLKYKFPLTHVKIISENNQKEFINLFSAILRMRNILSSFDEWEENELITEREFQDYSSKYLDLRDERVGRNNTEVKDINDDIVFELELLKQVDIDIDYILLLVQKYKDSHGKDGDIILKIQKAVNSSPELRSKKALIESFIKGINEVDDVLIAWKEEIAKKKEELLKALINEEKLKENKTRKLIIEAFENDELRTTGTAIAELLPPMSRFGDAAKKRSIKKERVIWKLKDYFEMFHNI